MHVDDPEPPDILVELQLTLSPVEGEVEVERFTVPVNPFRADTVATKEPVAPELKATLDGLAVKLKSGDWALKNSVIGLALPSLDVKFAKFQFASMVLVKE